MGEYRHTHETIIGLHGQELYSNQREKESEKRESFGLLCRRPCASPWPPSWALVLLCAALRASASVDLGAESGCGPWLPRRCRSPRARPHGQPQLREGLVRMQACRWLVKGEDEDEDEHEEEHGQQRLVSCGAELRQRGRGGVPAAAGAGSRTASTHRGRRCMMRTTCSTRWHRCALD